MLNADWGALSDEFDDPSSLADWQQITQVEGWGAQHFDVVDASVNPGALTIAPNTSTWYQDYQGDLLFKEVSGDFVVTTHVSITDRDDIGGSDADDIPNDGTFSLGGIMLRSPRGITDAAAEWTPGGSNFVFLSMGHGYDGGMSLESKSTQDSVSNLELIPVNSTMAELRVERSGATMTTSYRLSGDADWTVAANLDRADMPETLQVGLVAYSDYQKTSTFEPFYANSHTLVDTPENAANSSNPAMAYNPDVQAIFDYIRFEGIETPDDPTDPTDEPTDPPDGPPTPTPPAEVVSELAVINAGFEDISGETPYNEFTFGPLVGWELYDPSNITSGGDGPQYFIGTLRPTVHESEPGVFQNFPGGASEGERVGIAFNFDGSGDGGEYGMEQTLADTLQANTTYSLSVDIGNIATGISVSGQTFQLDGLPGYRVELLAGGQVIAMDDNSLAGAIEEGEFGTSTIEFQTAESHPQLGQALGIRLVNLNETAGVPAGNDLEVDFDNVRLTATSLAFQQIGNQTVHHAGTLEIDLATESGGLPVSYVVEVLGSERWDLDQEFDLNAGGYEADGSPLYYEEYAGYGVKWLNTSAGEGWMFLEEGGTLHLWQGSLETSPIIAELGDEVFADPSLLHDATLGGTATIEGDTLTIDPIDGFVGSYQVSLTKTAGEQVEVEVFSVEVTNTFAVPTIGDQSVATDTVLEVSLPEFDADGDTIAYEVEVIENVAADLRDAYQVDAETWLVDSDYAFNYLGQQERWVQSSAGWMFITESGAVHAWNGNYETSPEVARLDARFHTDPGLLVNAEHVEISTNYADGLLQISVAGGYLGEAHIRLNATDGIESSEQAFTVNFTAPSWAASVDDAFDDEDEDPWT